MDEQIKKVMSAVFGLDQSQIKENASTDSIENWDSLQHINLIMALEEEFDLEFDSDDITKMISFNEIHAVIKNKKVD